MYAAVSRYDQLAIGIANHVALSEGGSKKENGGPENVSGPLLFYRQGRSSLRTLWTDLDDGGVRNSDGKQVRSSVKLFLKYSGWSFELTR